MSDQQCRLCKCTNARACPGGCTWVLPDLCSKCLLNASIADLKVLTAGGVTIPVDFEVLVAFQIVGTLQLALRHPKFTGLVAAAARHVAEMLSDRLAELSPPLGKSCELGFNAQHDVDSGTTITGRIIHP